MHRDFIMPYLTCYRDYLRAHSGAGTVGKLNQERMLTAALAAKGLEVRPITTLNCYYTAEAKTDRTTWGVISRHPAHDVLCKYCEQCSEAFRNKARWDAGDRWGVEEDGTLAISARFAE